MHRLERIAATLKQKQRSAQEQAEEKVFGVVPEEHYETLGKFPEQTQLIVEDMTMLRRWADLPFLATDRSVMNLPGVGKSLTFRVIGITRYGRRILEFDHDRTRANSPIIDRLGKVIVIESKSIREYLRQLGDLGEEISEYESCYGYSMGQTEPRMPLYEYPDYDYEPTQEITNFELPDTEPSAAGGASARR